MFTNPAGVAAPIGAYSHVAHVTAGSDLYFVSGQVGIAPDGTLPKDLVGQADQTFANIVRIAKGLGLGIESIAKINTYLVAGQNIQEMRAVRLKHFGDHKPASTAVIVAALVAPEYLIEVEAVLVRPRA